MLNIKQKIATRVARELKSGDLINLGIGIPTEVANCLPEGVDIILHSENGFINLGAKPTEAEQDKDLTNAGSLPATIEKGGAFFDLTTSLGMMRGGHVDVTVLGALQVSEQGDIANWSIPGKYTPGMGGAMDLVVGAKKVIVAMEHTVNGEPKILNKCTLPLTAVSAVGMIVTELAVFKIKDKKMTLIEYSRDTDLDMIKKLTPANYTVATDVKFIED